MKEKFKSTVFVSNERQAWYINSIEYFANQDILIWEIPDKYLNIIFVILINNLNLSNYEDNI